jgi:hypothetical protein
MNAKLNGRLHTLLRERGVKHIVGRDGVVRYSTAEEEYVENEIICAIRDSVFSSWQILTCPAEWTSRYKGYMRQREIPFEEELIDYELWFLIPQKYRPHSWKLPERASSRRIGAAR